MPFLGCFVPRGLPATAGNAAIPLLSDFILSTYIYGVNRKSMVLLEMCILNNLRMNKTCSRFFPFFFLIFFFFEGVEYVNFSVDFIVSLVKVSCA